MAWILPDWPAPPEVRALSTQRSGGVSAAPFESLNLGAHVGDSAEAVGENRRRLRTAARLPAEPVWLSQQHGTNVLDLDGARDAPAGADASFTRRPGRVCAILTADCMPVLLASDSGAGVAAAHAGWRGLAAGVIEATVRALALAPAVAPGMARAGHRARPFRDRGRSPRGAAARRPASRSGIRAERARPVHGRPRRTRAPQARAARHCADLRRRCLHLRRSGGLFLVSAGRADGAAGDPDMARKIDRPSRRDVELRGPTPTY